MLNNATLPSPLFPLLHKKNWDMLAEFLLGYMQDPSAYLWSNM